MLLLQLPPETLRLIFEEIGSAFFQEDLNRLTICKQWYEFALPECLRRVILSGDTLKRLVNAGVLKQPSALRNSCEVLSLYLGGDSTRPYPLTDQAFASISRSEDASAPLGEMPQEDNLANSKTLDNNLADLAMLTQRSHKLRTLYIRAWRCPSLGPLGNQGDYPSLPTIRSLLSVDNLAVLVLDLPAGFWDSAEYQGAGCQLCPTIGALLGKLRALQLRTRAICPDALKPQSDSYRLRLTKLVVNLSLATHLPWETAVAHSKRCGSDGGGLLQLKEDLQREAKGLVPRMEAPQMLRILTHTLPGFETRALDVLTGKTMILDDNVTWDQDGRIHEEYSPPSPELSEDALAAFLNSDDE